jgi:hypothetical protein
VRWALATARDSPTLCPEFLAKYPDGRLFAAAARRRI